MSKFNFNFVDSAKNLNELLADNKMEIKLGSFDAAKRESIEEAHVASIEDTERLAYALVNYGVDPVSGLQLTTKDIDEAINNISLKLKDLTGISATSVLTQQVIVRALQYVDIPPTIFQYFSIEMPFKTGTQLLLPYMGDAVSARDIGPGQEIPTISFDQDAEIITKTNRSGARVQLDEEVMRTSSYNIMTTYMQMAQRSLVRWKDYKAVATVLSNGRVMFDNVNPKASVLGYTSGRSAVDGKLNGGFTLKDLFSMYMQGIKDGYRMDTIILSHWGYLLFMNEPTLRKFIEFNGGVLFAAVNGIAGASKRDLVAKVSRETNPSAMNEYAPQIPKELINVNFKIIVTDYVPTYNTGDALLKTLETGGQTVDVPYNWTSALYKDADTTAYAVTNVQGMVGGVLKTLTSADSVDVADPKVYCGKNAMTDLVMLDSANALLYLKEEGVKIDSKIDTIYELTTVVFRERYSFAMLEKSRAVLVAKNLVITDDLFDYQYRTTATVTEMNDALAKGVK